MSKDVIAAGLAQLVQQFQEQPKIRALLESWLGRLQEIEDAIEQLRTDRSLDTAEGVQLDGIGQILGLRRGGMDDEEYRGRLRVQLRVLYGEGTPEDILGALALAAPGLGVALHETFPAEVRVVVGEAVSPETGRLLWRLVRTMKPAGVRAWMESGQTEPATSFCFDGGEGLGFGDGAFRGVEVA